LGREVERMSEPRLNYDVIQVHESTGYERLLEQRRKDAQGPTS
jgi:hypothetical protein